MMFECIGFVLLMYKFFPVLFQRKEVEMKVTIIDYEDLPEGEGDNQPDNGCGAEDASYLRVEIPGEVTVFYSDAMEPEDATFYRDLRWVKDALLKAYKAGSEI